jgi:exodeoxyribonuclease VII small subunit
MNNKRPPSASPPDAKGTDTSAPTFEASIKRLTEIVQALERGDLPLEESLGLFEEGVKLSRASQQRLNAAEKKVEQLLSVDEQGRAKTAPFDTTADEDDEPSEDEAPF